MMGWVDIMPRDSRAKVGASKSVRSPTTLNGNREC